MGMDIFNDKNKRGSRTANFDQAYETCCPFLGLKNDQTIALGYPNNRNHCYHHSQAVPVAQDQQIEYCLANKFDTCSIFLQEPLVEPSSRKFPLWLKFSPRLALVLPFILIVIAALVWWPVPGTSIEDFTSNAAPLRNLIISAEIDQPPLVRNIRATKNHAQAVLTKPQTTVEAVNIQPVPTITPKSQAIPRYEGLAKDISGGFRIHIYE